MKGAFAPVIKEGLDKEAFPDTLARYLGTFNAIYIMLAKAEKGMVPVGLMVCMDGGYRIEPHCIWFPWATPRNKLEAFLNFFNKIRVTRLVILFIPEDDIRVFQHLERYGVIQRRGTISRFFEDGQFAAIFQSRD